MIIKIKNKYKIRLIKEEKNEKKSSDLKEKR